MASLFHCGQADGYSEAVASLRRAQDTRRVPKAAVTKPLDHVRHSGVDRDRRRRALKVCVVGCVLGRQSGGCGVAGCREGSRDAWATGCWERGPEVMQPPRKAVRSARNARHAGGTELGRWGRREWWLKHDDAHFERPASPIAPDDAHFERPASPIPIHPRVADVIQRFSDGRLRHPSDILRPSERGYSL